jgi:DNA polymerase
MSLDCCAAPGQDRLVEMNRETLSGRDLAGALAWWREAGVGHDFADQPRTWVSEPEAIELSAAPLRNEPAPIPEVRIGGDPAGLPQTLDTFREWWLIEPSLDGGSIQGRIAPRGSTAAEVMVLVPHPEADDRECLLSGPQGKLIEAMLTAMQIAPDQAYLASALPRHTPHPDWVTLQRTGIAEVLARHIALAAPKRLITFGGNILPLLGHDPAKSGETLHEFNHEGRSIPLLPAMELGVLLGNPRRKASFWQRWLDWTR